jgi:dolichyl-phosphate beta-glucosyltransferase
VTTTRRRQLVESFALTGAALVGSAALWGRLWVTSPTTKGVCGCGDPSLFEWFLAWPEHAIATGHSLVFSRDLFAPHGVNLLSNTSVLALGVPLAPFTWLWGPVLTENLALVLAVPFAVWTMDLLLRRVTASIAARVVLSLAFGFSPYVLVSLVVGHLMTAWIGVLPLLCLGVIDSLADDPRRARRGQVLLFFSIVAQFFLGTELLVLAVLAAALTLVVLGATWACSRRAPRPSGASFAQLGWPLGLAGVVLAVPAAYALDGPSSLTGRIWGPGFTPAANGTSLAALVDPAPSQHSLLAISGYAGASPENLQYLGWGLVAVSVLVVAWRWRDPVVRTAALVAAACAVLALSPTSVHWAPWRWLANVPILENILQRRIVVFALLGCLLIVARGADAALRLGTAGRVATLVALGVLVVSLAVPESGAIPFRTVAISTPSWWRATPRNAVVLSYPFPGRTIESPLAWQASSAFATELVGGAGPGALPSRGGADERAITILDTLSFPLLSRTAATPSTASAIRALVRRDGVTEVVVPVVVHGGTLSAGGTPAAAAAVFLAEVLGQAPVVVRDAWVFDVTGGLRTARLVPPVVATRCARSARSRPSSLGRCLALRGAR